MTTEMDIDMDLDIDCVEDLAHHDIDLARHLDIDTHSEQSEAKPILDTPNDTSGPNSLNVVPNKVFLRGLENLTTKDIHNYVATYFKSHKPTHIEWIDDLSANLVFPSSEIAADALRALASSEVSDLSSIPALQTLEAKTFPRHSEIKLEARLAVIGDRKQAGARERSRFYLFNPEYDPLIRGKRITSKVTKTYRNKKETVHRLNRYDDREQRRRERRTEFDSRLYDDVEMPVLNQERTGKRGPKSKGSVESDVVDSYSQQVCPKKFTKELFPGHEDSSRGRLIDNIDTSFWNDENTFKEILHHTNLENSGNTIRSNNYKQQISRGDYEDNYNRDLFSRTSSKHSAATLENIDSTPDAFHRTTALPLHKTAKHVKTGDNRALLVQLPRRNGGNPKEISIRGLAKSLSSTNQGFSIKGVSSSLQVKELFSPPVSENAGRELFSRKANAKGHQRKQNKELFS